MWLLVRATGSYYPLDFKGNAANFKPVWAHKQPQGVGVSIGRFGSVFSNFCKTEPNRLDLATEPTQFGSVFRIFRLGQYFSIISYIFNHRYIIIL